MSRNDEEKIVSIVLPTYNGEDHIRQAIESCLAQSHERMELIVVDDGSTDNTPDIVGAYKDDRIRFLRKAEKQGLPGALNAGFEKATGWFFSWISDDNYYAPNALEEMVTFLRGSNDVFVYCDFYRFDESDPSDMQLVRLPEVPVLRKHNDIGPCFMYSREVFRRVGGYDESACLVEDYDYWVRISKVFPMRHLGQPLYYYRSRRSSLSSRQHEVQAASVLLRLDHQLIRPGEAASQFIKVLAAASDPGKSGPRSKATRFTRLAWARAKLTSGIKQVMHDFHARRIDFREAKARLITYFER